MAMNGRKSSHNVTLRVMRSAEFYSERTRRAVVPSKMNWTAKGAVTPVQDEVRKKTLLPVQQNMVYVLVGIYSNRNLD